MNNERRRAGQGLPYIIRIRANIDTAIGAATGISPPRPLTPAIDAARVIAASRGKAGDADLIDYLAGLSEATSESRREQLDGVKRLRRLLSHPEHGDNARTILDSFIASAGQRRHPRPSRRAVLLAKRALQRPDQRNPTTSGTTPCTRAQTTEAAGVATGAPTASHPASWLARIGSCVRWALRLVHRASRDQPLVSVIAIGSSIVIGALTIAFVGLLQVVEQTWMVVVDAGRPYDLTLAAMSALVLVAYATRAIALHQQQISTTVLETRMRSSDRMSVVRRLPPLLSRSWRPGWVAEELVSVATTDLQTVWQPLGSVVLSWVGVTSVAAILIVLAVIDWLLFVLGLLLVVTLGLGGIYYLRLVGPYAERASALRDRIFSLTDVGSSTELGDAQRYGRRSSEFAAASAELRVAMTRLGRTRACFGPLFAAAPAFATLLALTLLLWRYGNSVPIADMMSVAFLLTALAPPIRALGVTLGKATSGAAAACRVERLMSEVGLSHAKSNGTSNGNTNKKKYRDVSIYYDHLPPAIRFDRVCFSFKADRPVFQQVSFEVPTGRLVALVAPPGSTAPAMLAASRLLTTGRAAPDAGRVLLFGTDVRSLSHGAVDAMIAVAPARSPCHDGSLREAVARVLGRGPQLLIVEDRLDRPATDPIAFDAMAAATDVLTVLVLTDRAEVATVADTAVFLEPTAVNPPTMPSGSPPTAPVHPGRVSSSHGGRKYRNRWYGMGPVELLTAAFESLRPSKTVYSDDAARTEVEARI